ncbi:MAG: hypothetical protein AB8B61_08975 [Cyclobacteriaceae bacterium]
MILLKEVLFANDIDGFSSVEYLIVFNAIIYGFITSFYFSRWGHMIQARKTIRFSYEHLAWTIFTFLNLVANWYGTWHRAEFINISVWYFFYSLVTPITYYFMAVLLFPKDDDETDFQDALDTNKKILFGVFTLNLFMSIINGLTYLENDVFDLQNAIRLLGVLIAALGIFTKQRYIHVFILTLGFMMLLIFLFTVPTIKAI